MAIGGAAAAFDAIAEGSRPIRDYQHLGMLKAELDGPSRGRSLVDRARAG